MIWLQCNVLLKTPDPDTHVMWCDANWQKPSTKHPCRSHPTRGIGTPHWSWTGQCVPPHHKNCSGPTQDIQVESIYIRPVNPPRKKSLSVTHSTQNSKSKDEIVACCDRIPETDWLYSLVCLCQAARGAGYFYIFVSIPTVHILHTHCLNTNPYTPSPPNWGTWKNSHICT